MLMIKGHVYFKNRKSTNNMLCFQDVHLNQIFQLYSLSYFHRSDQNNKANKKLNHFYKSEKGAIIYLSKEMLT